MSEAPERIKIWPDVNDHFNPPRSDWSSGHWDDTNDPTGTEYVRADLVQAAVAAALTEAAVKVRPKLPASGNGIVVAELHRQADDILALITPDAQAALDRVVAKRIEELKGDKDE